ncbi:hypothetical protein [Bacillus weihaiensis]|uniref:hypothetical protein n=1 Tax=Bacillus weihaiensis TaxID=1547283 RepID=UPI0023525C6D|nr:hypothetical protein [Bacillus weihaiensis]
MLKIAQNLINKYKLDVKLVNSTGDFLGEYERETDTIKLNINKIQKIYKFKRKKELSYVKSLNEYIEVITCHELGHREDKEKRQKPSECIKELIGKDIKNISEEIYHNEIKEKAINRLLEEELAAWELGRKYVRQDLMRAYDILNQDYLYRKRNKFEVDLDAQMSFIIESVGRY